MRSYTQYGSQQGQRSSQPSTSSRLSLASNTPIGSSRQTNSSTRAGDRAYSTQRTSSSFNAPARQTSHAEMFHHTPSYNIYDSSRRATTGQPTATSTSRGWTEPPANSYYRSYGGWPNYMHSHGLSIWDDDDVEEGRAIRDSYRDADRAAWERQQHQETHSSTRSNAGSQHTTRSSLNGQSSYDSRYSSADTPSVSYGYSSTYSNYAGSNYGGRDYSHNDSSTQDYTSGRPAESTYYSGYAQSAVAPSTQSVAASTGNATWDYRDAAGYYYYDDDDDDTSAASSGAAAASSSDSSARDADVRVACSGFAEVIYEESGNASSEDEVYDSPNDYDGYDDQGGHSDYDGYSDGGDYDDDDDYYSD